MSDTVLMLYCFNYIQELACRDDQRQAPFERIAADPTDFINAEYMPTDVELKDPRSMKVESLVKFFKHVAEREDSHGISDSFKFKSVLSSRKKGTLLPARYKGDDDATISEDTSVPLPPRRRKRRQIRPALDNLPLLDNNTLPMIQTPDPTAELVNGLYTPGDTPAQDDINSDAAAETTKMLHLKSRLPLTPDGTEADTVSPSARLRSRLPLTPDGTEADYVSPSVSRRSLRSSDKSSPLTETTKKQRKAKKKRGR